MGIVNRNPTEFPPQPPETSVVSQLPNQLEPDLGYSDLPHEWLAELLDPDGWQDVLALYASTVNLAVALTDVHGRLLGKCYNPQPVWRLAHGERPALDGTCPFCLAPQEPCTAVADAVRTGFAVLVQDKAGLAHIAVPVSLGGQPLGALLAGQIFTQYPEPLRLQRVAKVYGITPQGLWREAVRQVPITRAYLLVYGNLLMSLGQGHLGERYADILNRKLAETNQTISRSLLEKEVLLREIHHRVKNNLQMVSSLLNMQSGRLDSVEDAKIVDALQTSQQRIGAMARIHDLLYDCKHVGEIDLAGYVKDLVETLVSTFQSKATHIQCRFDLVPVTIALKHAIPCGLIVNELVTNVFKYAYPHNEDGEIYIGVKPWANDRASLTISDQGIGVPDGLDWKRSDSLGFQIIDTLTTQIGGTFQLDTKRGFSFTIDFPRTSAVGIGKEA